jgi:hypothetical protein
MRIAPMTKRPAMASGRRDELDRGPNGSLGDGDTDATTGRTETRDGSGVTVPPPGCGAGGCAMNPWGDDATSAVGTDAVRSRAGGGGGRGATGRALVDGTGALGKTGAGNAANEGARARGGGSDGTTGVIRPGRDGVEVGGAGGRVTCAAKALAIGGGTGCGTAAETTGGGGCVGSTGADG